MAGRPPNPKTPEAIHERELLEWGQVSERIRKRIGVELAYFERIPDVQGADGANLDAHLAVSAELRQLAACVSSIMERGLRLAQQRPADAAEGDTAAIERELLGS